MSDLKEKLAAARKAKEERDAARAAKREEAELAVLELEAKYEKELGPRGVDFEIVDTVEGPIVVKLGEAVLHTRFQSKGDKYTDADVFDYVDPCVVHPSKEKFREMIGRKPVFAVRCASALATLFGAKSDEDNSKF
jgi:hypothetical protein